MNLTAPRPETTGVANYWDSLLTELHHGPYLDGGFVTDKIEEGVREGRTEDVYRLAKLRIALLQVKAQAAPDLFFPLNHLQVAVNEAREMEPLVSKFRPKNRAIQDVLCLDTREEYTAVLDIFKQLAKTAYSHFSDIPTRDGNRLPSLPRAPYRAMRSAPNLTKLCSTVDQHAGSSPMLEEASNSYASLIREMEKKR